MSKKKEYGPHRLWDAARGHHHQQRYEISVSVLGRDSPAVGPKPCGTQDKGIPASAEDAGRSQSRPRVYIKGSYQT